MEGPQATLLKRSTRRHKGIPILMAWLAHNGAPHYTLGAQWRTPFYDGRTMAQRPNYRMGAHWCTALNAGRTLTHCIMRWAHSDAPHYTLDAHWRIPLYDGCTIAHCIMRWMYNGAPYYRREGILAQNQLRHIRTHWNRHYKISE